MTTALDYIRVEVAFSADPNTATPAFTDLTSRAFLTRSGIAITRGRQDEFTENAPGRCTLTFDNADGKLTPGHPSAFTNLKAQNRLRVTYRDPAAGDGNLLSWNASSMETDVSDWGSNDAFGTLTPSAVASSTTHPQSGAKGGLITWPTTAIGSGCWTAATGLVIGRVYTVSGYVWVPTGSPDVRMFTVFGASGTPTSTKNAMTRISVTFTAVSETHFVGVYVPSATAGDQCWFDAVQVDEGPNVRTFTTAPAPIVYRFDGYVDGWPTAWPSGGASEATTTVTAYDLASRLTRGRKLGSVIEETWGLDNPAWHFPLTEPSGATSAGDIIGTGRTLTIVQRGSGGELTFGDGTGPGTDSGTAAVFTPVSNSNGKFLSGDVEPAGGFFTPGVSLEATFLTSQNTNIQTIARISNYDGTALEMRITSAGTVRASFIDPWTGTLGVDDLTGPARNDGQTHTARIAVTYGTGAERIVSIRVDGGSEYSGTAYSGSYLPLLSQRLEIGGTVKASTLFTGTISHVALFPVVLDATQSAAHATAVSTGFAGERSDQRIARIASWVGLPAALLALDVGAATIAHVPSNGRNAWDYMQAVADTEGGNFYVSVTGVITLRNRTYTFDETPAVVATVTADDIGPDTSLEHNLGIIANDVTVSREGGASFHVKDDASIQAYGSFDASQTILSDTDAAAFDRANWTLASRSVPVTRLTQLVLDALSGTAAAALRSLAIDSRVSVTGMPSQSPASSFDLRVQGYTETIGADGWVTVANTTPFVILHALVLDDTTRGTLDTTNHLAY